MRFISIIIYMFLWLILSLRFEIFYIGFGIIISILCAYLFPISQKFLSLLNLNSLISFRNLLKEILYTSYNLTKKLVLNSKMTTKTYKEDISKLDELEKIQKANAITLTPGTLVIELDEKNLKIHHFG